MLEGKRSASHANAMEFLACNGLIVNEPRTMSDVHTSHLSTRHITHSPYIDISYDPDRNVLFHPHRLQRFQVSCKFFLLPNFRAFDLSSKCQPKQQHSMDSSFSDDDMELSNPPDPLLPSTDEVLDQFAVLHYSDVAFPDLGMENPAAMKFDPSDPYASEIEDAGLRKRSETEDAEDRAISEIDDAGTSSDI